MTYPQLAVRRAVAAIESGTSVNAMDFPSAEDEVGVLKTSCVSNGYFDATENKVVDPDELDRASCPVRSDRLIVSRMNTPALVGAAGHTQRDYDNLYLPDRLWQVRTSEAAVARFVYWWMQTREYRDQVAAICVGTSSSMQNLSQNDFRSFQMPFPSHAIQSAISEFLDRETAHIDELIGKQERLIKLLAEKRQAVITHAATKGLDPTAPTKRSGVPWLGEVPAHWDVVGSRRIFSERGERARADDEQLTSSQAYGILTQASFVAMTGSRVTSVIKGDEILKHVEPDDFVISMRSFQGGLELSRVRGKISSAYVMLVPNPSVDVEYFRWLFKCDRYIAGLQSTSNLVRDGQALRFANFAQLRLPAPPIEEQKAIAAWIEEKLAAMDKLHTRVAQSIDLLRERRSALISAAVTGKIDVRKEAS